MVAHLEIVKKFAERKVNCRTGSRIYSDGDTLYSYGSHFPLARYLGERGGHSIFVKNGDRYSSSTSGHQSTTQSACEGPTVSVSALRAAGINFHNLRFPWSPTPDNCGDEPRPYILGFRPDSRQYLYRDKDGGYWKEVDYKTIKRAKPKFKEPFVPPRQGMFMAHNNGDSNYESGVWHILGAALIEQGGHQFLCSLDEGQYFVAQLPVLVSTIDQAFKALKPPEVQRAERHGVQVLRQGEWFFIPTGLDHQAFAEKVALSGKTKLLELAKAAPLPQRQRADGNEDIRTRNKHCCRQFFVVGEGIYAVGHVYHRNGWNDRVTNEHRTLHLGDQWHKVCLNTELASWTVGGRFD